MPGTILPHGGTAILIDDRGSLPDDLASAAREAGLHDLDTDAALAEFQADAPGRALRAEAGDYPLTGEPLVLEHRRIALRDGRAASWTVTAGNVRGAHCMAIIVSVGEDRLFFATAAEARTLVAMLGGEV